MSGSYCLRCKRDVTVEGWGAHEASEQHQAAPPTTSRAYPQPDAMSEVTSASSGGTVLAETLWAAYKTSDMNQPTSALDKIVFVAGVEEAYRLGCEVTEAAIRARLEAKYAVLVNEVRLGVHGDPAHRYGPTRTDWRWCSVCAALRAALGRHQHLVAEVLDD